MTLDERDVGQQSHRALERQLRQRPGRATALPNPGGKPPVPVTDDAATRKADLARVNDFIRQSSARTPWPGTGDDAGPEAA